LDEGVRGCRRDGPDGCMRPCGHRVARMSIAAFVQFLSKKVVRWRMRSV